MSRSRGSVLRDPSCSGGQLPGVRWVEPYVPLAPAAPVHPNALGMRRMAGVVAGAMSR